MDFLSLIWNITQYLFLSIGTICGALFISASFQERKELCEQYNVLSWAIALGINILIFSLFLGGWIWKLG